MTFVVHHAAVSGVGEPDAAIRMHHDVVGCVERFVLPLVGQHGGRAVVFVADNAAVAVFAGKLAAIKIEGVAVAVAAGMSKDADMVIFFQQAHLPVIGNIAPHKIATDPIPGAALGPKAAGRQPLDRRVADLVFLESLVEHDNVRVGITHRVPAAPITFGGAWGGRQRHASRCNRSGGNKPASIYGMVFHGEFRRCADASSLHS